MDRPAGEHFRLDFPTPAAGEHTLEIKVVDSAQNVTVSKVKFKVP